MIYITGVMSHEIPMAWPDVSEYLQRAVDRSEDMAIEQVRLKCLKREMQLWVILDDGKLKGAFTTELTPPMVRLLFLGGDGVDDWLTQVVDAAEKFGAAHGCEYCEVIGRKGWEKYGRKLGYKHIYTVYRKEITHGRQILPGNHDNRSAGGPVERSTTVS